MFNLNMFLEFPGILIPVGVLLLIIALIIGIVSMKKSKKEEQLADSQPKPVEVPAEQNNVAPVTENILRPNDEAMNNNVMPNVSEEVANNGMPIPPAEEVPNVEPQTSPVDIKVAEEPIDNPNEVSWPTNTAYGGADPSEGIKFNFIDNKNSVPYGEVNHKVEEVPSIINNLEEKKNLVDQEEKEDIEML